MIRFLIVEGHDEVTMRNLIERIRKKDEVRCISKINEIPSKSISDLLRPINVLSNIFGLRVFEFPRDRSRPVLSFVYSMSLCWLYIVVWLYCQERNKALKKYIKLDRIISYIPIIINHKVTLIILMMGLYHSQVSSKTLYDISILTILPL